MPPPGTLLMVPSFLIPFRLVGLSGTVFFRTLWPTLSYSLIMTAVAGGWRYVLARAGVEKAAVELSTTVAIGGGTYFALVLWRRPSVLEEVATLLRGANHPVLRPLSRILPTQ